MYRRPPVNSHNFSGCIRPLVVAVSIVMPVASLLCAIYFFDSKTTQTNTNTRTTAYTRTNTNTHTRTNTSTHANTRTDTNTDPPANAHKTDNALCIKPSVCHMAGVREYKAGNYSEADLFLEYSCQNGVGESCMVQGLMALEGKIGPASMKDAINYFKTGCDMGSGEACRYLADTIYRNSEGDDKAQAEAAALRQRACHLGSADDCLRYGEFLIRTGQEEESFKALSYMEKACSLDSKGAACQKARDAREQIWLRKGGDDNASSKKAKARARRNAENVPDTPEGLRTACAADDAGACYRLGFYYEHAPELSPPERRDRALEIYGELCRKRDPQGCEGFRRIKNAFAR